MCHKYWPDSGTQMYGFFEITLHSMKEYPDYILREFKIVDSRVSSNTFSLILLVLACTCIYMHSLSSKFTSFEIENCANF